MATPDWLIPVEEGDVEADVSNAPEWFQKRKHAQEVVESVDFPTMSEGTRVSSATTGQPVGRAYPSLGQVSTEPSPYTPPTKPTSAWDVPGAFAQGTKEGTAALLGTPVDITNSLLGLPFGKTNGLIQQPFGGSQSILNALRTVAPDYDVQPGFASNIARLAGQQAPTMLIPAAGAAKAGTTPLKAVATTLPSEAGAAVAGGTIKTLYPENEIAQLTATLVGGFGTAGAQTIAKNWVNPDLNVRINRTLNAVAPATSADFGDLSGGSLLEVQKKGIDGAKAITVANKQQPFVYKNLEGRVIKQGLPESRIEFAEAIDQMKTRLYNEFNSKQKAAGQAGLSFSGDDINARLQSYLDDPSAPPSASLENRYLLRTMKMYEGKQLTPSQMEKELALVNARLKAYYKNPSPNLANKASADAKLAQILRDELDSGIRHFEGPGYQQLRNEYGNIRALQDRIGRAAQKQLKEEGEPGKWYDIKDVGIGVGTALSMTQDPMYAAVGGSLLGARQVGRYLTQPDRRIKRMFQTTEKLFKPEPKIGPIPGAEERFTMPAYEGELIPPSRDLVPTGTQRGQTVEGQYQNVRMNPEQRGIPWNPQLRTGETKPGVVVHPGVTTQQAAGFDFNAALQSLVENGYSPVEARDILNRQIRAELARRNR